MARLKTIVKCGQALLLCAALHACSTPKNISYLQGVEDGTVLAGAVQPIRLQAGDKISIVTKSKNPQLSELFNLPVTSYRVGTTGATSYNQQMSCYTVTADGSIDFPVLGRIAVAGLTREEVAARVKGRLVEENLVKDPVVTVEYENLRFSVMGEVNNPGEYTIDRDRVTLLDALSKAGDLTIYGRRDNVAVVRTEGGKKTVYRVNLTDAASLAASPAASLRQNDVVYVDPNNVRKRQSTLNGNNVLSTSFWVSVASLLTSIAVLIVK